MYVGKLLQKVTANGVDDYRYSIYGNGQLIALMSRTSAGVNTTRYVLTDHQGSVAKVTDSSGNSIVSESFTAFGARRNPKTWSGQPTYGDLTNISAISRDGYTGQTALGNMGLNHMNGRVQDAITGRFLSADPYITQPGITQNYNRYSYVLNNPLTLIDPSGFCENDTNNGDACELPDINVTADPYEPDIYPPDMPLYDNPSPDSLTPYSGQGGTGAAADTPAEAPAPPKKKPRKQCIADNHWYVDVAAGTAQGTVTTYIASGGNPLAAAVGGVIGGGAGYLVSQLDNDPADQAGGRAEIGGAAGIVRNGINGGSLIGAFTGGFVGGAVGGATGNSILGATVGGVVGGANAAAIADTSLITGAVRGGFAGLVGASVGSGIRSLGESVLSYVCQ